MMAMFNDKPVIGPQGASGVTFTPSVSAEGVISWTNDGGLPNPEPVNVKGPKGDPGGVDSVDTAMSDSSENPVQNKVITAEINGLRGDLAAIDEDLQSMNSGIIPNLSEPAYLYEQIDYSPYVLNDYLSTLTYNNYIIENNMGLKHAEIPVNVGDLYRVHGWVYANHTLYGFMDSNKKVTLVYPKGNDGIIPDSGGVALEMSELVTVPAGVSYLVINQGGSWLVSKTTLEKVTRDGISIRDDVSIPRLERKIETLENGVNVLWGKKLGTVGTSITQGVAIPFDDVTGIRMTYGAITAQRNNMAFVNYGIGGSTLQNIEGKNPFCVDRYQNMDKDLDYITLEFGWNDYAYGTLGTIDDTVDTTYYGAWNKVLPWLIENYPNAKIGLIVPYGCSPEMRDAVRIVAKKYGIGFMDMTGNPNIPLLFNREASFSVDSAIETLYRNRYLSDGIHPNNDGYKAWATAFEDFLKSL